MHRCLSVYFALPSLERSQHSSICLTDDMQTPCSHVKPRLLIVVMSQPERVDQQSHFDFLSMIRDMAVSHLWPLFFCTMGNGLEQMANEAQKMPRLEIECFDWMPSPDMCMFPKFIVES